MLIVTLIQVVEDASEIPGQPQEDHEPPSSMFGDIRSEDERLAFALELAFNEISKDKSEGKDEEQTLAET